MNNVAKVSSQHLAHRRRGNENKTRKIKEKQ
jgi:hypothetical protein